jgi:hypothetical protein
VPSSKVTENVELRWVRPEPGDIRRKTRLQMEKGSTEVDPFSSFYFQYIRRVNRFRAFCLWIAGGAGTEVLGARSKVGKAKRGFGHARATDWHAPATEPRRALRAACLCGSKAYKTGLQNKRYGGPCLRWGEGYQWCSSPNRSDMTWTLGSHAWLRQGRPKPASRDLRREKLV